jgi:hypothetical protein
LEQKGHHSNIRRKTSKPHQIVEQWFRTLSAELANFLSKYLANLEDLAALETKKKTQTSNPSRR